MAARGAGSTWPRRAALVPRKAKDRARRFVGGEDAARAVEDDHGIGKALDGGVRGLTGLHRRELCSNSASLSAMALKSAARAAVSRPSTIRARAPKSFPTRRRGLGEDAQRAQGARDAAAGDEDSQEGGDRRSDGFLCTSTGSVYVLLTQRWNARAARI